MTTQVKMPRFEGSGPSPGPSESLSKGNGAINAIALSVLTVAGTLNMLTLGFAVQSSYIKTTAVVMQELIKVVVSLIMIVHGNNGSFNGAITQIRENCLDHTLGIMAIPAVLYAFGNIMTIYIVAYLDPAMFQVFGQLKIVTTAIFCRILLNKVLSMNQTMAVLVLLTGVITVKVAQANAKAAAVGENGNAATLEDDNSVGAGGVLFGMTLAILQAMMSGFCGAYLEKQFKQVSPKGGANLWTKNVQLGSIGFVMALVTTFVKGDGAAIAEKGFFQGYNFYVWSTILLSSLNGILNAIIMKYADNIIKGFAVAVSMILTVFLSAVFFGFHLNVPTFYGASLVVLATFMYSGQVKMLADNLDNRQAGVIIAGGVSAFVLGSWICSTFLI